MPPRHGAQRAHAELGRALGLLQEEHVTDVLEDLQARAGYQLGDHVAVLDGEQLVEGAMHHLRRATTLGSRALVSCPAIACIWRMITSTGRP